MSEKLDTDISDSFDDEQAAEENAELDYRHFKLDDEREIAFSSSLDQPITVDGEYFIGVSTEYDKSNMILAQQKADAEDPDNVDERARDAQVLHSNEDGDVGVPLMKRESKTLDEIIEEFSRKHEDADSSDEQTDEEQPEPVAET